MKSKYGLTYGCLAPSKAANSCCKKQGYLNTLCLWACIFLSTPLSSLHICDCLWFREVFPSTAQCASCLMSTWPFQKNETKRDADLMWKIFSLSLPMQVSNSEKCGLHRFWRSTLCSVFFSLVSCVRCFLATEHTIIELARAGAVAARPVAAFPAT